MDRGAWRAAVHNVTKSRTQQKRLSMYTHTKCTHAQKFPQQPFFNDKPKLKTKLFFFCRMYKQVVVICVRSHFSHCKINTKVDYRENKRNKLLIQLQLEESQYYVKQKQLQKSTYCMISLMNSGNNEKNLF